MTAAPLASTIVAVGLIPVAFLFCHAFLSGRGKNRFHPVTGVLAISWDLTMSIGYMLYRSFGGAVEGASLQLTPTLDVYFGVHGAIAILVMSLEVAVLAIGLSQLKQKAPNRCHGKLAKILFFVWWFAFFSGEIFYIIMYVL
ncbi:MAG: hypothetical protein NT043_04620 [Candidatus Bathyarchaeota archaeon]|nr:hypothetical protein [Candidatus Bathyarchaeota archaeon]